MKQLNRTKCLSVVKFLFVLTINLMLLSNNDDRVNLFNYIIIREISTYLNVKCLSVR